MMRSNWMRRRGRVLQLVWSEVVHALLEAIPKAWSFQHCFTVPCSSWRGMLQLCLSPPCSPALAYPLGSPTPTVLSMYTSVSWSKLSACFRGKLRRARSLGVGSDSASNPVYLSLHTKE